MARQTKAKEKTLSGYRRCLDAAKGFRKQAQLDGPNGLWARCIDLYKGQHFPKNTTYDDLIVINIAKATVDVILPSIAINYPKIVLTALKPEAYDGAPILEAVVNYWWRHFDVQPEMQDVVKDYLIMGLGIAKVGYRYVEEEEDDDEATEAEFERRREDLDLFAEDNPELAGDLPDDDALRDEVGVQTKLVVVEDRPFVERVSPQDVFVDPEATSPRNMSWIAQRVVKPLKDVKEDPNYEQVARREIESDEAVDSEWLNADPLRREAVQKDEVDRCTIWEWYDLRSGTMCVFSDSGDHFLVEPTPMPYTFGHPFLFLQNYLVPDQFYPMGELEALEGLQDELNLTRTAMFNDRKGFRRKWLYKSDSITGASRVALESDDDNVFVPIEGQDPLDQVVAHMPTPAPNPQLYQDTQVIENDIATVSAISEYQRGDAPEIRRTATEASIIQDAANARAAFKLTQVERFMGEVASHLSQLAQQFVDAEQVAMVTQLDGRPFWFEFDAEDIAGEFSFSVEAGSTEPQNEVTRRRTALDLLQALGPLMDPQLGLVNTPELLKYVLQSGFGFQNPERFLAQQQNAMTQGMGDPVMAQQQQLAQQLQQDPGTIDPEIAGDGQLPPELLAMLLGQGGGGPAPAAAPPGGPAPAALLPPGDPSAAPPGGLAPGTLVGGEAGALPPELLALIGEAGGGPSGIPPELLAQLQGQVGLSL